MAGLARHSIRHLVKAELAARIRQRLDDAGRERVVVDVGHPGEDDTGDAVWVADIEGSKEREYIGAPGQRSGSEDHFTVLVFIQIFRPDGDRAAAEADAAVLIDAVEDVLLEDAELGGLEGLMTLGGSEDGDPAWRVVGPNAHSPAAGGVMADAALSIPGFSRHD